MAPAMRPARSGIGNRSRSRTIEDGAVSAAPRWLLIAISVLAVMALACGSDDSAPDAETVVEDEGPPVVRTGETFAVDDFVDAGWKKSKEFSAATVPKAESVWYRFYDRRDVEIRFYASHEDAIGEGVVSAESVMARSPNSNIGGGIITSAGNRTQYEAYLVAGNAVVLCQTDVTACVELVGNIP